MLGGGGIDPRQLQQMMEQMGIEVDEMDVTEVVMTTADGEELVFDSPEVTRMDAQGQRTYQIVGEAEQREATVEESASTIPAEDVELVAQQADVSDDDAKAALEETDGDLAAAIDRLS